MSLIGKSTVSRADLVRLYAAFGLEALGNVCALTGYQRSPAEKQPPLALPPLEIAVSETTKVQDETVGIDFSPDEKIEMPFWRPVKFQAIQREDQRHQPPEKYIQAKVLETKDLQANPLYRPPEPQPLCPWSRMWPFLRDVLGETQARGAVDMAQVVQRVAEMRPIRRLPRRLRRRWARRNLIIFDCDTRLLPFWRDMRRLYQDLLKIRGAVGLELQSFEHGPLGPVRRSDKLGVIPSGFTPPDPNTPILIVSDLGLFDRATSTIRDWLLFGKKLRWAGFYPVVLTPAPRRLWIKELTSVFRMACWDRGQRLPKLTGPQSPGIKPFFSSVEKREGPDLLLSLLSVAIRVEPELLRAARLLLPTDQVDAGDEAAVWHHEYVRRGYTGFFFDPQFVNELRNAFLDLPDHLRRAIFELIPVYHRHLSPVVLQEERMIAAMLSHGRASQEEEDYFWRLLKSYDQPGFSEKAGFKDWSRRFAHRHEHFTGMWRNPAACAVWAQANREAWTRGKAVLPEGMDPACAIWILGEQGTTQDYTLFRRGDHFVIQRSEQGEVFDDAATVMGSPVVNLTSSNGVLQIKALTGSEKTEPYLINLRQATPEPIQAPWDGILQLTTNHHEITLENTHRPAWALGWGRDAKGLYLMLQQGEQTRKAYWFTPGTYRVFEKAYALTVKSPIRYESTTSQTKFEVSRGFWWDEEEFKDHREQGFQKPAWAHDFGKDQYGFYADFSYKGVTQRMRWIMPGEFLMGSPASEPARYDNETQHEVILTRGFWLAETACTQALWQAVMQENPSRFKGDDRPVEDISWQDCQLFIARLNAAIPGLAIGLPTEAQWEYACRAGTTTPFNFGETITTDQANFDGNYPYHNGPKGEYRKQTVAVKRFPCNPWGLYEMHGNLWEWCADWYGLYPQTTTVDPSGPNEGITRVLRGGSWIDGGRSVRSAYRRHREPAARGGYYGLRLARGQTGSQAFGGAGQGR